MKTMKLLVDRMGKSDRVQILLQNAKKDPNYQKVMEIVEQTLSNRKPLLVAALVVVTETLNRNSSIDNGYYLSTDNDGKNLLQFAELCYKNLHKKYEKAIA
jgi:hypothetical protein